MLTVKYRLQSGLIGVISDTHVPARASSLPPEIFRLFKGADLILHAGDLEEESVLEELGTLAPVEAVAGNMDPANLKSRLGIGKIIDLGEISLGLMHGAGMPRGVPDLVLSRFEGHAIQGLIFGHSHVPFLEQRGDLLLLNPGSTADPCRGSASPCARLWVDVRKISGEILELGPQP